MQRYIYKLDGLHNVKKIRPMPDFKIQLFWFLFPTLSLFLAANHDSSPITLFWRSIPSPFTTLSTAAHARIFQNGGKFAPFFEIRCHYSSPSSLCIHSWFQLSRYLRQQLYNFKNVLIEKKSAYKHYILKKSY